MTTKNSPKNVPKYLCKFCDYACSKRSDYAKHLSTLRHFDQIQGLQNSPQHNTYHCECGKIYSCRQNLHRHKRTCKTTTTEQSQPNTSSTDIMQLIQQNQEFKELLIEQNKQMMELYKEGRTINHHNTTTTNHHNNQKFNLNFFLNTTCKDAINMSDFIQTIEIQMGELENIGHNGYVAGMTDIILSRIKDLDISKRPVHCTDLKRETMYIKDQNEWNKDTAEKSYLRRAIAMVAKKNYGKTMEWRERNPECLEVGTPKYDFCFKMMRNVLGDFEDIQIRLDNKIIKSLAKEVVVDR